MWTYYKKQYLQTKGLTFDRVVIKLKALKFFLHDERESLVEKAIKNASGYEIPIERRTRCKKQMAGKEERDAGLTLQEENK